MKKLLNNLSIYFETVPNRVRKRRLIIWGLFIVATVIVSMGIPRLKVDMSLDAWFPKDDPAKVALNQFRSVFGSDDGIFIVYKPKDGDVFSKESLKAVDGIREDLLNFRIHLKDGEKSELERITRVDTIVSANVLKVNGNVIVSEKFVGNNFPTSETERKILVERANKQKNFPLRYFSRDLKYGGIAIQTDLGTIPLDTGEESDQFSQTGEMEEDDIIPMTVDKSVADELINYKPVEMEEYVNLNNAIEKILNKPEYTKHLEYFPVGNTPIMTILLKMMNEVGPFYMGMLLIIIAMLWFLLRSFSGVLWPITTVILSSVWSMGIVGWLGTTVTNILILTVMLILAIGIADTVHILSGYLFFRNKGMDHPQALNAAFRKSALACLLTSVTTIVGMLALAFIPIQPISVFGYTSALGVGCAFLFTIYLLPLMMDIWPPVSRKSKSMALSEKQNIIRRFFNKIKIGFPNPALLSQKVLDKVFPITSKYPIQIIIIYIGVFLICIYGATKVRIDSNYLDTVKEDHILRQIYDVVDTHMMGTQNLEIYLDLGENNAFQNPEVLQAVELLQQNIETKYNKLVTHTYSLADVVKDAYKVLNEGLEDNHIIPENPKVLQQTLFLFNNSSPEDRRKLVSDNYDKSHISIQLHNAGSLEYTEFFRNVKIDIEVIFGSLKATYPDLKISLTGGLALSMQAVDFISRAQIRGFGVAVLIISILLIFMFGSIRNGALAVIPNLLPAFLTFGLLGLLNIPLDSNTLVLAPVIIGIAVDDTIHLLTHFREEFERGQDVVTSLKNSIQEVGQAVMFTSFILGFGFLILTLSAHLGIVKVGFLGVLAVFTALSSDLFFLPALILVFKSKQVHQNVSPVKAKFN